MSKKKKKANATPPPPPRSSATPAIAWAALAVFVLLVIIWVWRGGHAGTAASAIAASPSPTVASSASPFAGKEFASQGHAHLNPGEPDDFVYNSNPPTSGPHKEVFSDQFISPTPLAAYVQVHLLEHGNVLLQYSCTCPDVVASLSSIAYAYDAPLIAPNELQPSATEVQQGEEEGKAVIVAPYPKMKARIALTAWTRLATLDNADKAKIDSFIGLYLTNLTNASR
jgi:uncharacterized protein DUF3105